MKYRRKKICKGMSAFEMRGGTTASKQREQDGEARGMYGKLSQWNDDRQVRHHREWLFIDNRSVTMSSFKSTA